MATREESLVRAMVDLADNLVDDFDIVDLLLNLSERCVETLDLSAAGILLAAPEGDLRLVASSSETMRLVELFELQADEGPCMDCYRSGRPVVNADLATVNGRWPRFAPVALGAGFHAAHALPLRLRGTTIGALNLFRTEAGALDPADVLAGQALADIATIAIVQHRVATEAQVVNEQLNRALNSRITIEQAKGMLAEQGGLDMDATFEMLRNHSRNNNVPLVEIASAVVAGDLTAASLDPSPPASGHCPSGHSASGR